MNKDLSRKIELPKGMKATLNGEELTLSMNGKEIKKKMSLHGVSLVIEGNSIIVSFNAATRRESAIIGTTWAHINNMIKGFSEEYVYELEICNLHFPMNVKKEGNKVVVKSFLGEKKDRIADILSGVNVEVSGNKITVSSSNRESAGQTAANLERATRLTNRDRRIFQDGIFLTSRCGRKI